VLADINACMSVLMPMSVFINLHVPILLLQYSSTVIVTLLFLAWIGNAVNNLFLAYLLGEWISILNAYLNFVKAINIYFLILIFNNCTFSPVSSPSSWAFASPHSSSWDLKGNPHSHKLIWYQEKE